MIHVQAMKPTILIGSQGMTNSATVTANFDTIDGTTGTKGDYATILLNLGSEINTNAIGPTLSILESDDTVVTNFATITADRSAEDITGAVPGIYNIDLRGRKRYLRLSVTTETTTNDNVEVGAVGLLSRNKQDPSSATEAAGGGFQVNI